ncbi:SIR2 family protein [Staphylococcus felis]|nr:SIR2 family protein [Staphylococcus felis]REI10099.1 SIR2 family protein [Staphylococcus felis]REI20572.1 SIR2 family protein [Staphylococcus felis]REI29717.1 SIR2 family protein [Staphylococcus felis]
MTIYHFNRDKDELEGLKISEQHDRISTFINKQLSANNLVLFLGSGCSTKAVPLMSQTMRKILDNNIVMKQVKRFLDSKEINEFVQFIESNRNHKEEIKEQIKENIENLKFRNLDKYVEWINKQGFEYKSQTMNIINDYYYSYTNIEELLNWIQNGLNFTNNRNLLRAFNIIKSEFINTIPETGAIEYEGETYETYRDFYRYVFDKRNKLKSKVSIFTTNYDLFNEYALEANNIIYNTGFANTLHKKFDINQFKYRVVDDTNKYKEKWQPVTKEANVYKIHGSINWKTNEKGELQQVDFINKENHQEVVIYPTMLKHRETAQAPYSELFREFSNCLQKKDTTLVIIGYGFPDDHINNIIAQNLKNQDFNLIIFGNKNESNLNEFYERHKNYNLHLIGGKTSIEKEKTENNTQNVHYFKYIVDNFLKSKSVDNIKKEEEYDEQYR